MHDAFGNPMEIPTKWEGPKLIFHTSTGVDPPKWFGLSLSTELFWYWQHDATAFMLGVAKTKREWRRHEAAHPKV